MYGVRRHLLRLESVSYRESVEKSGSPLFDHAYADRCDSGTGNIIRRSSNTLQRGNFSDLDCRDPVLAVVSGIDYDNIRQFVLGCRHRNFSCSNGLVRIYHLDGDSWNQGDCAEDKEQEITGYKKQKGK